MPCPNIDNLPSHFLKHKPMHGDKQEESVRDIIYYLLYFVSSSLFMLCRLACTLFIACSIIPPLLALFLRRLLPWSLTLTFSPMYSCVRLQPGLQSLLLNSWVINMKAHQRYFWIPLTNVVQLYNQLKKIFFFPRWTSQYYHGPCVSSVHKPTESAWKCVSQQKNLAVIFFGNKLGLYIVSID